MRQRIQILVIVLSVIGILSGLQSCTPPAPLQVPAQIPATPTPDAQAQLTADWAYQQGTQALGNTQYDSAIQYFYLAIERDPKFLRAYLELGEVYQRQANYLAAETSYNKALQIDDKSVPALIGLAATYRQMGNHREALKLYQKILEIEPGNQSAQQQLADTTQEMLTLHYEQGMAYKEAGDLVLATVELQKAYSLAPEKKELAVEIGDLFFGQQDYMMADGYYQQALKTDPEFLPALIGAGKTQLSLKNYDEAIRYLEHALQVQPENYEATSFLDLAQHEKLSETVPQEYWSINMQPQATRGDVAALLVIELKLEERLPPPAKMVIISDITTHWAKPYIIKAVQYGLLRLPPDRFFQPNDPIQKGELAVAIDRVFDKLALPLSAEKTVTFADVHPDNSYHDAIVRVCSTGLMTTSAEGVFGVRDPLSGEELIQLVDKIKTMLK